jgi:D-aminoacyl-tRNA deacylase
MRVVLQKVKRATVFHNGTECTGIGMGYLLLVGIPSGCTYEMVDRSIPKILEHRLFGEWTEDIRDVGGEILVLSQFTLFDSFRKKRPSFHRAERHEAAREKFDYFCSTLESRYGGKVRRGPFGSHLEIELVNMGPCTMILEVEPESTDPNT